MIRDAAVGLLLGTAVSPGSVRQIAVPPSARALCTLSRIDYEDAFLVQIGSAQDRTPEQWARAVLEDSPAALRSALLRGWSSLGLQLGPIRSGGFVLGWKVQRSTPDFVLLGAESRLGLRAELLLKRHRKMLL